MFIYALSVSSNLYCYMMGFKSPYIVLDFILHCRLSFFQGLNNLQSTFQGFGHVNSDNVFKVCPILGS